jgi:hypothetical protein
VTRVRKGVTECETEKPGLEAVKLSNLEVAAEERLSRLSSGTATAQLRRFWRPDLPPSIGGLETKRSLAYLLLCLLQTNFRLFRSHTLLWHHVTVTMTRFFGSSRFLDHLTVPVAI